MLHSYFAVEPELEPKIVHGFSLPDCIYSLLVRDRWRKFFPFLAGSSPEVIQRRNWTHYLSCRWPGQGPCIWSPEPGRREDVKERWSGRQTLPSRQSTQTFPGGSIVLPLTPGTRMRNADFRPHLCSRARTKHVYAALIIWENTNRRLSHVKQCFLPQG